MFPSRGDLKDWIQYATENTLTSHFVGDIVG